MKLFQLLTILSLTSCGFWPVGPDYKKPKTQLPKNWQATQNIKSSEKEQISNFEKSEYDWWKNFQDPILDKIVKIAIAQNYDYQIAQSRVMEARANVLSANSDLGPKGSLKASGSRGNNYFNFFSPKSKNKIVDFFSTGFDVSWELDLFGANYRSRQAAKALNEASDDAKNYILISLIAEVVKNYAEVRASQNDLLIEQKIAKYYEEISNLNKDRNNVGILSDIDFGHIRINRINSEINLAEAKSRSKIAIHNLEILLGQRPNSMQKILSEVNPVPILRNPAIVEAPLSILRNRPDIRQAERELEAATALKGVAIAQVFPKVSLTGFLGFNNTRPGNVLQSSSKVFSTGAQASMPVLNFGGIVAGYRISEEHRKQALLNYKSKINQALSDVETSLINFSKEEEKLDLSQEKFEISQIISHLNKERYKKGIILYANYLMAEIEFLQTSKSLNQAKLDFSEKTISLYKSLGGGWQNLEEKQLSKLKIPKKYVFKQGQTKTTLDKKIETSKFPPLLDPSLPKKE